MERRIALGISMILVGVAFASMMVGVGSAQQGTATYGFEECEEGWTVEINSDNPVAPGWERAAPGDESEFAWHATDIPVTGTETFLISPVHQAAGSAVNLGYRFAYSNVGDDFELLAVEWSTDGAAWTELENYQGESEGYPAFIDGSQTFTPPAGPFQVRFRFFSDVLGEGTALADVDNVTINRPEPAEATCETPSASPSGSTSASASPTGSPAPTVSPTGGPSPSPSPTEPPVDPRGCTIFGTEDNDELTGTSGADIICGYEGNDTINGRGGNDKVYGDSGGDSVRGGSGNDRLKGGGGKDNLRGGKGNDKHNGGGGTDTCKDDQGSNRFQSCEKS